MEKIKTVKKRKVESIDARQRRAKEGNDLSCKKERDYSSDTKDETNLNQANNKY